MTDSETDDFVDFPALELLSQFFDGSFQIVGLPEVVLGFDNASVSGQGDETLECPRIDVITHRRTASSSISSPFAGINCFSTTLDFLRFRPLRDVTNRNEFSSLQLSFVILNEKLKWEILVERFPEGLAAITI